MSYEDCIDVVKEWVIAQVYATEAWVTEQIQIAYDALFTLISDLRTWTQGKFDALKCFENRGDPAGNDFATHNFTQDNTWHELDLSGIVPADAKGVVVSLLLLNAGVGRYFALRQHGNVNSWNVSGNTIQVANIFYRTDATCPVDGDRHIDYFASAAGWTIINMTVKGWWF